MMQTNLTVPTGSRMTARVIRCLLIGAVLGTTALAACHDATNGTAPRVPQVPPSVMMVVEPDVGNDSLVTVGIRLVGLDTPAVASLTADIVYDTTRMRFRFDGSAHDGAMRAMYPARGRVSVAVAHATGLTDDVAARLAFSVRDTAAYQSLRLSIREMHRIDATDARRTLTVVPAPTQLRSARP
jgi:hypothetical protein